MVILRVGATVAVLGALSSQVATAQRQFVGLIGGATLSDFGAVSSSSRWGGTAGVTFGFRTTNYSVVNLEASWVQKGAGDVRLDYIDIPLTVGGVARAGRNGELRTRFYAGIGLGVKVGCSSPVPLALDCDNAKSTEWAVPFGLQLGRWSPSGMFVGVDVRWSIALSDAFSTSNAYNRTWYFRAIVGRQLGGSRRRR